MSRSGVYILAITCFMMAACSKSNQQKPVPPPPASFEFSTVKVNGISNGFAYKGLNTSPVIKISFSSALNHGAVSGALSFTSGTGTAVNYTTAYQNGDSTLVITPAGLQALNKYTIAVSTALKSSAGGSLVSPLTVNLQTGIDTTNKFPVVTDTQLLDIVEKQTFKYFYDFGHPVSGLARERNTSGDVVTMGGSGFHSVCAARQKYASVDCLQFLE